MSPSVHVLRTASIAIEIECATPALHARFGPRFDRSAYVRDVPVNGRTFLASPGLCDEFGLLGTGVLGFDAAPPGGTFIKIGVGRLTRGRGPEYHFSEPYTVAETFNVDVQANEQRVTVEQLLPPHERWSYASRKSYAINEAGDVTIQYLLRNSGNEAFSFEHYNHHWFAFPHAPIGPEYSIIPAFAIPANPTPGWLILNGAIHLSGDGLDQHGVPWRWSPPGGQSALRLAHCELSQQVDIRADFLLSRFALWANQEAICPELFHATTLLPGESSRWEVSYRFSVDPTDLR